MSNLLNLLAHLPLVAVFSAIVVAGFTFVNAAFALRAKRRMRHLIEMRASSDLRMHELRNRKLNDLDSAVARKMIIQASDELSQKDRSVVAQGVTQSSRSGERRFIRELISS